jgi:hypothetical protein
VGVSDYERGMEKTSLKSGRSGSLPQRLGTLNHT